MLIDIALISLDVTNFRHKEVQTESDAIRLMLSNEKQHKIGELAQDIIDLGGLDPSSLLIVTNDIRNPGHYIALEGNRRITALKAMISPDLAAGLPTHHLFKRLAATFMSMNITRVECIILNKQIAAEWIKRKHYKGMGGRGTLAWDAVATARSDASEGRFTRWMTALAFLEDNGSDAEDLRERISSKTTTVERVLGSPLIGSSLGLVFGKSGTLVPDNGDVRAACVLLEALLDAMADKSFTEPSVSTAEQQREFISAFAALSVLKMPSSEAADRAETSSDNSKVAPPGDTASKSKGSGSAQSSKASKATNGAEPIQKSKPIRLRKKLAPAGLRISNVNLNKFYLELRNINTEKNPFICAAIIRIFLEKSTTCFLEAMSIPPLNPNAGASWREAKLRDKVTAVLRVIDPSKNNPKLRYAWEVANGVQQKLHSLDELNYAIHDHHTLPSPTEIVTTWDRVHPYFAAIFEHLEKNGK